VAPRRACRDRSSDARRKPAQEAGAAGCVSPLRDPRAPKRHTTIPSPPGNSRPTPAHQISDSRSCGMPRCGLRCQRGYLHRRSPSTALRRPCGRCRVRIGLPFDCPHGLDTNCRFRKHNSTVAESISILIAWPRLALIRRTGKESRP
jgi:hypothetical protein